VTEVPLAAELLPLLGPQMDGEEAVQAKQRRLQAYLERVGQAISGEKAAVPLDGLARSLFEKAERLAARIRAQEWLPDSQGPGWFNGYYDNDGRRIEGRDPGGVRMTLTGQVFPLMAGVASDEQAAQVARAVESHLRDERTGVYRLNTDLGAASASLGRLWGFAYGHKENGAVFNHMAVMYAYALYQRGLVSEGWRVLDALYAHCQDFRWSRIYPGIPEYFNPRGRGMYPYLTGSAAWYLFTLLTQAFGIHGRLGDLVLEPKLAAAQFAASDRLSVRTVFAGKTLEIEYHNPRRLDYGAYAISSVTVGRRRVPQEGGSTLATFARADVAAWPERTRLLVQLGER
jgi:cellobiose phosphorylase